jgi:hypothetical protein
VNGLAGSGCIRTGVKVNVVLRMPKVAWDFGFHEKGLSLQVRAVKGVVIWE